MKTILSLIFSSIIILLDAQTFSVNGTLTPQQLVNQKLLGGGVIATNITYIGNPKSIGFFKVKNKPNPWPANKDSLGLDSGLFLTSGVYDDLGTGPLPANQSVFNGPANNFQSFQSLAGSSTGDVDLTALAGNSTQDAAVLEFDFEPQGDKLEFKFIFASEEYNDYVNSINDVFGFFVNGVNVTLAKTNIALIPNSTAPITINSVNNGSSGSGAAGAGPCVNCTYYRDNWNSEINGVYDGYTTVLTAKLNVECGKTYHIKIAIADVSDHIFDSGVFLEANSFKSSQLFIANNTNLNDVQQYKDIIYEGCVVDTITFDRGSPKPIVESYKIDYTGSTATAADFIDPLPDSLTFNVNEQKGQLILKTKDNDGIEGPELLRLLVKLPQIASSCVIQPDTLIELTIRDKINVKVYSGKDSIYDCPNPKITLSGRMTQGVDKNVYYAWYEKKPSGIGVDTIFRNKVGKVKLDSIFPDRSLNYSKSYYFTAKDFCGKSSIDTITIGRKPYIAITGTTQNLFKDCPKDSVLLKGAYDNGVKPYYVNIFGSNNLGLNLSNFENEDTLATNLDSFKIYVKPLATATYNIRTQDKCKIFPANLFVSKVNVGVGILPLTGDPLLDSTVICEGKNFNIAINPKGGVRKYKYFWSNGNVIDSTITVSPEKTTRYFYRWTDRCEVDTLLDTILVKVSKVKANFTENVPALKSGAQGDLLGNFNTTKFDNLTTNNDTSVTHEWYLNGVKISTNKDFEFNLDYDKDNAVKLVSTNSRGCISIYEKPIAAQTFVNVPNVFTPDNDNVNEKFASINKGVVNYNLQIFNRWGALVYESKEPKEGWNGSVNGTKAEDGTYFVVLKYNEREGGKENKYQGYVKLVR
jgi:gliding motility-associated-like protein